MTDLVQYVCDLEDLVRWLARTYGENDPIWPYENEYHQPLEANRRLAATWAKVVRGDLTEEVPSEEGEEGNDVN